MSRKLENRRSGTKQDLIASALERGLGRNQAYSELRPLVDSQISPLIFTRNPTATEKLSGITHRIPKSIPAQLIELRHAIARIAVQLELDNDGEDFKPEEIEDKSSIEPEEKPEEKPEGKRPIAAGKNRILAEMIRFRDGVHRARALCERRERQSAELDDISMRPAQGANKLIQAGVPADFLLYSMAMHWGQDAREEAGIFTDTPREFSDGRLTELSLKLASERNALGFIDSEGHPAHKLFGYALVLAECRQPIYLVGSHGTGKSKLIRQVADFMKLPYGEAPMNPGATRGDLLGRHTIGGVDTAIALAIRAMRGDDEAFKRLNAIADGEAGGFITSLLCLLFSGGGVFNFEELDASDPSMVIVLNNALASNKLFNSSNGQEYDKSPNFIPAAAGNTFGEGATRKNTGRERQDAAFLDRWRLGRIWVPIDTDIEDKLLFGSFYDAWKASTN